MATLFVDKRGTGFSRTRPIPGIGLYLEPGTIVVSSPDSVANAVVSGTPLNNDDQKLSIILKPTADKMDKLMNEYRAATTEQRKSKEFEENMENRYEAIRGEQKKIRAQFIKENPASLVSMYALQRYDFECPDYAEVALCSMVYRTR